MLMNWFAHVCSIHQESLNMVKKGGKGDDKDLVKKAVDKYELPLQSGKKLCRTADALILGQKEPKPKAKGKAKAKASSA